jgi:hypothetical protein
VAGRLPVVVMVSEMTESRMRSTNSAIDIRKWGIRVKRPSRRGWWRALLSLSAVRRPAFGRQTVSLWFARSMRQPHAAQCP